MPALHVLAIAVELGDVAGLLALFAAVFPEALT
jgi:hypothetical protein